MSLLRRSLRAALRRGLPPALRQALSRQLDQARRDLVPQPLVLPRTANVVVLAPHADDETFGCGGTLALLSDAGCAVHPVFLTDGRHGHAAAPAPGVDRAALEQALVHRRRAEAAAAAALLGLQAPQFLDAEDGRLAEDAQLPARLAALLSRLGPALLLLPHPADRHADHAATLPLLLRAAALARLPGALPCWGYEVWTPVVANGHVDIGAALQRKAAAMRAYASQIQTLDFPGAIQGLNAYRALSAGLGNGAAEAFHVDTLDGWRQASQR